MHVNPAVIGEKSGRYNTNSAAHSNRNAAENKAVSADKAVKTAEKAPQKDGKQDEFSFWDLVDIINPLQHIPLVNTVYREITGDQINSFGRIAGGALFGGFAGAALGGVNAIVKHDTGNDLGELAMVKTGFRPDVKKNDDTLNMVPVVDKKKFADKQIAQNERATLDHIIWDAPSLLQVATKETIAWDGPSVAVVEQPVQVADNTKVQEAVKDKIPAPAVRDALPAHVVRDVEPDAYQMAAAMPDPKSLNDIEPGSPSSPLPQGADVSNVPNTMMQALSKYQSMQRLGGENVVAAQNLQLAEARTNGISKFSKLEGKVRRY